MSHLKYLASYIAAVAVMLIAATVAWATDSFQSGMDAYTKGDHNSAHGHFRAHLTKNPKDFRAYYQLGNIHLAAGDYFGAEQYYRLCVNNNPDVPTATHCAKALDFIGKLPAKHHVSRIHNLGRRIAARPAPSPKQDTPEIAGGATAEPEAVPETKESKRLLDSHADLLSTVADEKAKRERDKILADAEKKADQIKAAAEAEIKEGNANSNQWWIFGDGSIGVTMGEEAEKAIRRQAEAKAEATLAEAKKKVRAIESTSTHVMESADGLKSQISSKGARLQSQGTNLYVRNYKNPDL